MKIMIKDIQMVVFDMAGTTVDEQNVVYKTLQRAINDYGVEVDLDTVLKHGAGKEKHQAIKDILTFVNPDRINESETIFKKFKTLLDKAYANLNVKPIEGVENVLSELRAKGIKVVLNTGYNRKIASSLLEKLNWKKDHHFDMLLTSSDIERGRPHPDMIQKAMKEFNIKNPKHVLKAGDSEIDIEEGKNAGCGITVGVLSGAQTKEQLEQIKPDYVLNSIKDLIV